MSEDSTCRVYVNGRPLEVPKSATVLQAVESADPSLAKGLRSGTSAVTDSRGLPIASDAPVHGGAIFRVVEVRARR